jgi:large subunit ribosomal protein L3
MGGNRVTVRNSMVVDVRPDENLLLVKGGIPGAVNQLVYVRLK